MFTEALPENTKKALELLGKSEMLKEAYLAGGTACALQLGHRISDDMDFFIPKEFDEKFVAESLKKVFHFQVYEISWGTILGFLEEVKFGLFFYKYPVIFPFKSLYNINILDLRDISAIKIDAIASRGKKRDFIDLYFICKEGITLKEILNFYEQKFGEISSNIIHIQKSLVYFVDADAEEMPKMIRDIKWNDVKRFFINEVKRLNNSI